MARGGPNVARRENIKRARRRAKEGDLLKLEELAGVWGVVKTRFVNVKGNIETLFGFPAPVPQGNTHLYPALEALDAMWKYETKDDQVDKERAKKIDRILGRGERGKGKASELYTLPIGEMAQLNRLSAEIEEREREQGLFVPLADVAQQAGALFDTFSEYLDDLDNRIDPNGRLPPEIGTSLRDMGAELLLKLHGQMKDMLSGHARPQPARSSGSRRTPRRAR